jgi:hypothetical protein
MDRNERTAAIAELIAEQNIRFIKMHLTRP